MPITEASIIKVGVAIKAKYPGKVPPPINVKMVVMPSVRVTRNPKIMALLITTISSAMDLSDMVVEVMMVETVCGCRQN